MNFFRVALTAVLLTLASLAFAVPPTPSASEKFIPRVAYSYNSYVIREARFQMGMNAPISTFAAQIHTESHWNLRAKSAYASGLSQFTPDTEKWIIKKFPDLGVEGVVDPHWAIRAMVKYDTWLLSKVEASTSCDDWAMALSSYNGGLGWTYRDKKLAKAAGKDPYLWWDNVSLYSARAPQFIKESRDYPVKILLERQPYYLVSGKWGETELCGEKLQ